MTGASAVCRQDSECDLSDDEGGTRSNRERGYKRQVRPDCEPVVAAEWQPASDPLPAWDELWRSLSAVVADALAGRSTGA